MNNLQKTEVQGRRLVDDEDEDRGNEGMGLIEV